MSPLNRTVETIADAKANAERDAICAALAANGWRLTPAAAALGVWPSQLLRRIERLGLGAEYRRKNPGPGRPKEPARKPARGRRARKAP
jgi:DNA-binding NtrC family response regulator